MVCNSYGLKMLVRSRYKILDHDNEHLGYKEISDKTFWSGYVDLEKSAKVQNL